MTIAITVDVEDWFQVENLRDAYPVESWPKQKYRVERNVNFILDALDTNSAKATFFVLGIIAERFPELVRQIGARGHDVESHGYGHIMLTAMSEHDIFDDLQKSKRILEDITGHRVRGFRAPSFSITDHALEMLAELEYEYDSSVYEFSLHDRYGKVDTTRFNKETGTAWRHDSGIMEFPLPMLNVLGIRMPWAGGGYFRLIPKPLFLLGVKAFLKRHDRYVFYMHPWEIDPDQPRVKSLPRLNYFKHYYGLADAAGKLDALMKLDTVLPVSVGLADSFPRVESA